MGIKQELVTERVIQELRRRTEKGLETYGRPLTTFDGRDTQWDAIEEVLDLAQYLMKGWMEQQALKERSWAELVKASQSSEGQLELDFKPDDVTK